jgi:hypothetical protein
MVSTLNMFRPLLNHALLIEAISLILLALLCTLCSTIVTNYSPNPAKPTSVTILPLIPTRTTLPSIFDSQQSPPAPNILQPQRGPLVAHWHKETPLFDQQFGSVLLKHSKGVQNYLGRIVTYNNMMSVRTRQGSNAIKKIEELRLINKKKNDKIRKQQEEEKKARKKHTGSKRKQRKRRRRL